MNSFSNVLISCVRGVCVCKGEGGVGLIGQREGGWIRVQFHVALFGHALPAVDVPDAIREVLPYVLEVHWLSVRVVRGGASTHLCPLGYSLDWSGVGGSGVVRGSQATPWIRLFVISAHVAWRVLLVCYFISFAYTYYTTRVHVHASYCTCENV